MANKFTHKFVNAGVKGKLTPSLFAARKSITATNRIGNTVASIGNVVWDMRQIAVKSAANKVLAEQAQRRREQRERDAEAEEAGTIHLQQRVWNLFGKAKVFSALITHDIIYGMCK